MVRLGSAELARSRLAHLRDLNAALASVRPMVEMRIGDEMEMGIEMEMGMEMVIDIFIEGQDTLPWATLAQSLKYKPSTCLMP